MSICHFDLIPLDILNEILEYSFEHCTYFFVRIDDSGLLELVCKKWRDIIHKSELCRYMIAMRKTPKSACKMVCAYFREVIHKKYPIGERLKITFDLEGFSLLQLKKFNDSSYMITKKRHSWVKTKWKTQIRILKNIIGKYVSNIRIVKHKFDDANMSSGKRMRKVILFNTSDLENMLHFIYITCWCRYSIQYICYINFGEGESINKLWDHVKKRVYNDKNTHGMPMWRLVNYMVANRCHVIGQLKKYRGTIDDLA